VNAVAGIYSVLVDSHIVVDFFLVVDVAIHTAVVVVVVFAAAAVLVVEG
jgi:hypothetical protein